MRFLDRVLEGDNPLYMSMRDEAMVAKKSRKRGYFKSAYWKNKIRRVGRFNMAFRLQREKEKGRYMRRLLNPIRTQPSGWAHVPRVFHDKYFRQAFSNDHLRGTENSDAVINYKSPLPKWIVEYRTNYLRNNI